jgi:hypothetical protein
MKADPYNKPGLYAVGQQIFLGFSQNMATKIEQDGIAAPPSNGNQATWSGVVKENALADPQWNTAMNRVVCLDWSVEKAWDKAEKEAQTEGRLHFDESEVRASSDFLKTYLQYK